MGQVTIEIPQNVNLRFTVRSKEVADEILRLVKNSKNKNPEKKLETITLNLPYNLDDVDENEAVGIWADREESGEMPVVIPPRRNSLKEDLAEAVGIWADREESADEIARTIRDRNNGKI